MTRGIWLETQELNEAINSLEMAREVLRSVIQDENYWKWIVIALHNSVQGFMVCALKGTNSFNVLRDDSARKWLKEYQSESGKYPHDILDTYLNLYEKIKSDKMKMYVHSEKFISTPQQDWSVKKLNCLRNKFIHFLPGGLSLEVSGLPQIVRDHAAIINFLVFESNNIIHLNDGFKGRIENLLDDIRDQINKIENEYTED